MDWIVLEGVKPYDGRYPFDIDGQDFTTREWGWIKRHAGYMPLTIEDGFAGADPELFAVFAGIALRRAEKIDVRDVPAVFERIADAPFGATVRVESDTPVEEEAEEGDAGPPETGRNGNPGSSGLVSPRNSGTSEQIRARSGTPASASSLSVPTTSET